MPPETPTHIVEAMSFNVEDVAHSEPLIRVYDPMSNTDPDEEADSIAIEVSAP